MTHDRAPAPGALTWRELVHWLLGRRRRVRVVGLSMLPSLRQGAEVLVNPRAYVVRGVHRLGVDGQPRLRRLPAPGEIVVVRHPQQPHLELVKRVAHADRDGVWVLGDNPEASTDSRHFGALHAEAIVGRVTVRFG